MRAAAWTVDVSRANTMPTAVPKLPTNKNVQSVKK